MPHLFYQLPKQGEGREIVASGPYPPRALSFAQIPIGLARMSPPSNAIPHEVRHRRFIASARSNLPIWAAEPPTVDENGRGFVLVGLGPCAPPILATWRGAISARKLVWREYFGAGDDAMAPAVARGFDEALSAAVVGWRLMLAASPSEVLILSARARAAGWIEEEIRAFALDDGRVRTQCIHCRTSFRVEGGPGSEVACPGCGRRLFVHQHLSRRHAALVSFITDFESRS